LVSEETVNEAPAAPEVLDTNTFMNQPQSAPVKPEPTPVNTIKHDLFGNNEVQDSNSTIEWNVENVNPTIFDLTEELNPVGNVQQPEAPVAEQPEVIRHVLVDDAADKVRNYRIQSTVLPEEAQRRNEERVAKLQEITSKIQNAESIMEFENEPAYMRRNFDVTEETPSKENNVSRFGLSSNNNGESGLGNNSYLHDNVD
jgi:cell division protein FtsZ